MKNYDPYRITAPVILRKSDPGRYILNPLAKLSDESEEKNNVLPQAPSPPLNP